MSDDEDSKGGGQTSKRRSWPESEADYSVILVDEPAPHVRRITLNRPENEMR